MHQGAVLHFVLLLACGVWGKVLHLSSVRDNVAATAVRDMALFGGGQERSFYYNTVDIYNATSNAWTTATLSQYGPAISATSAGPLALFAGGLINSTITAVVDAFNADKREWFTLALSSPRCYVGAASVRDLMIFAGGGT